jgi:hypothetical protein
MIKQFATTIVFGACALAQGQTAEEKLKAEAVQVRADTIKQAVAFSFTSSQDSTLAGAPYSADETTTTTQTLFDGNRIVNTSSTKVYRDQQGRTRVERTLSNIGSVAASQPTVSITINDPVAGTRYTLDAASRTAYKSPAIAALTDAVKVANAQRNEDIVLRMKKLTDELQVQKVTGSEPSQTYTFTGPNGVIRVNDTGKREDLGTSNMAGVPVKGSRTTNVIPAGTVGNDRDINIVEERWYSPDLQMNIMTKHTDPRMGETVFQVNNLTRSNPDPSLFQVPADYQIKEGARPAVRIVTRD